MAGSSWIPACGRGLGAVVGEGVWWRVCFLGGVLRELEQGLDPQQDGAMAVFLGPDSEALGGREPPADLCDPGEW